MMKILKHGENYQNVTQRRKVSKCLKTGANRPAQSRVPTDLQFENTEYLHTTKDQSTIKHGMSAEGRWETRHLQEDEQAQASLGCMQTWVQEEPHSWSGFPPPGACTVCSDHMLKSWGYTLIRAPSKDHYHISVLT